MRFFIALEIPDNSKAELESVQRKLKELIPPFKPSEVDKLHLTIAFVGEEDARFKGPLTEILHESVKDVSPFTVTPGYIDGFPHLHNAHVLWIGVKGDIDKLFLIRHRIKDGLESLKLNVDERRFVPHIALGKVANFALDAYQEAQLEKLELHTFNSIRVDSLKLFESAFTINLYCSPHACPEK